MKQVLVFSARPKKEAEAPPDPDQWTYTIIVFSVWFFLAGGFALWANTCTTERMETTLSDILFDIIFLILPVVGVVPFFTGFWPMLLPLYLDMATPFCLATFFLSLIWMIIASYYMVDFYRQKRQGKPPAKPFPGLHYNK